MRSLRALLHGVVDYAGLFPPAALGMTNAVAEYAAHRAGSHAWMLGRFAVPAARLEEFARAAHACLPAAGEPWRVSALAGPDPHADAVAIAAFNVAWRGRVIADAVELRAANLAAAASALDVGDRSLERYVELPVQADLPPLLALLAERGARAKVRTGGVTADAFPAPRELIRFIRAALDAKVPFKATAGLHHPLSGRYALTYEPGSARAPMYGFLNLFIAAALMSQGLEDGDAVALLAEASADAFRFSDESLEWRGLTISVSELARVRREVATSFGSCSFREPVADLQALALL
jgi:hypothetical protein